MRTYGTMNNMAHNTSPHVPEWQLSDRLRKIRRDAHMTQAAFAHELGIKEVTYAAYEAGRNRPGDVIGLAVQIEHRFGVPAAWVLGVLAEQRGDCEGGEIPEQRQRRRWADAVPMVATA